MVHKRIKYCALLLIALGIFIGSFMLNMSITNGESGYDSELVELTEQEKTYIKDNPTVTIAGDKSWRPLEYVNEDGNYAGVIAEILSYIQDYTGLKVEYVVNDSYSKALEAVQKGNADIVSGLAYDENTASTYNVKLTDPYLTINSAVVTNNDESLYDNKQKTIAVVAGDYANSEIKSKINNAKLVECDSNETCLDKVKSGSVDMAIIASYCAEYYSSVPTYSSLKIHTISDFSWQLSFGIKSRNDDILVSILNKSIYKMNQFNINEAVYEGVTNAAYDNDFMILIYRHPVMVISIVSIIAVIIVGLCLIIFFGRKKEHMRQVESEVRLRLALERTNLCIWEYDIASSKIVHVNNPKERHGFYDLRENIPNSVIESGYIHPEDINVVKEVLEKVNEGEQNVQGCWRIKELSSSNDTSYWWEQVLFHIVYDERNRPIKAIGVSEDVTKEKDAQRDSLTLVYNRSSFEEKANSVLHERRNAYLECAYLILDLDGFKQINDTYGHSTGDRVLISVGTVLNKTFRSTDIVGRLGGDEFTVFMTSISCPEDASRKAQEVVENICNIKEKDNYPFDISCSLGVVVGTRGQEDLPTLYKRADLALYEAKNSGKNQFKVYKKDE